MIPARQTPGSGLACSTTEHFGVSESGVDHRLRVAVVFSTTEGTLAALKTAGNLATDLGARVLLVVPQVVPLRFPVDQPPVAIEFLERRQLALVSASGIEADEVSIEIYPCRNRKDCLRKVLSSPSLIVVGGKRRWWFARERKLEHYLRTLGHHVVFVEMEANNHAGSLLHSDLRAVLRRLLGLHQGV